MTREGILSPPSEALMHWVDERRNTVTQSISTGQMIVHARLSHMFITYLPLIKSLSVVIVARNRLDPHASRQLARSC